MRHSSNNPSFTPARTVSGDVYDFFDYDGESFIYHREGNKAVLTAEKGPTNWYRRYEITLMPKTK